MGGIPGPPPKRSEERRRRNDDGIAIEKVNLDELIKREVEIPVPPTHEVVDEESGEIDIVQSWDPIARMMWESFTRSGQAIWYEPTDWATAYMLCEVLDRWMKPQEVRVGEIRPGQQEGGEVTYVFEDKILAMPGGVLTAIMKAMSELMANEGGRRKLRIELERRGAIDAALSGAPPVSITQKRDEAFAAARKAHEAQGA